MRPTSCNFTSPKQKTGEYLYPQVTASGVNLSYEKPWPVNSPKTHTMTLEKRFRRRILKDKLDGSLPGPGTNETKHPYTTIESRINSSHHVVSYHFFIYRF
jgi:hypothetical protein